MGTIGVYDPAPALAAVDGMGVEDAADYLGVSTRTIARWRAGTRMTLHTADKVATRMGRHLDDLWPECRLR